MPEESGRKNVLSSKDYEKMVDDNNLSIRQFLIELKAGLGKDDLVRNLDM